jgi:hypothetical protein
MNAFKGIALTFAFTAALSVLAILLFRFPVPFAGIIGPFGDLPVGNLLEAVTGALMAWVTYTLIGGALPQLGLGAAVGIGLGRRFAGSPMKNRAIAIGALLSALLMVLGLSTLDWFIGPW